MIHLKLLAGNFYGERRYVKWNLDSSFFLPLYCLNVYNKDYFCDDKMFSIVTFSDIGNVLCTFGATELLRSNFRLKGWSKWHMAYISGSSDVELGCEARKQWWQRVV